MTLRLALEGLTAGERELDREASHYLLSVHRLRVGDRCVAFDPRAGLEADLAIVAWRKKWARVELSSVRPASRLATRAITLIQGLAKGQKTDAIVRDATELGATRILIARCARSVKLDVDLGRCERVALDAARQCGRGDVPRIEQAASFAEGLGLAGEGQRILLLPDAPRWLGELDLGARSPLVLAVGPEGGFDADELRAAVEAGFVAARIGAFVLRTETAAAAALGAVASQPSGEER